MTLPRRRPLGRTRILAATIWFYAAAGAAVSVFGPSLESISDEFGITYGQVSLVITTISVGFLTGSLAGGAISDRSGRKVMLVLSAAGSSVALVWMAASPSFGSLLAASFLAGGALGPGAAVSTALVADAARERSTRALNLVNTAFALGAILAPSLVAVCLAVFANWRVAYLVVAVWLATGAVVFARLSYPPRRGASPPFRTVLSGLLSPAPVLVGLVLTMYVGVEIAFADFGAAFMEHVQGIARTAAAASVTAFWIGILAGRLVVVRLAATWPAERIIRRSLILALAMSTLTALASSAPMAVLGFALTGAALGGVFPTVMGIGVRLRPEMSGALAGALVAMAGVGGAVLAPMLGAASDAAGPRGGMLLAPAFIVAAMVLFELVQVRRRRNARDVTRLTAPSVESSIDA